MAPLLQKQDYQMLEYLIDTMPCPCRQGFDGPRIVKLLNVFRPLRQLVDDFVLTSTVTPSGPYIHDSSPISAKTLSPYYWSRRLSTSRGVWYNVAASTAASRHSCRSPKRIHGNSLAPSFQGTKIKLPRHTFEPSFIYDSWFLGHIFSHFLRPATLLREVLPLSGSGVRLPPGMLQNALCSHSLPGIQFQHCHQQIHPDCSRRRKHGCVELSPSDRDNFVTGNVVGQGAYARPILLSWRSDSLADFRDLSISPAEVAMSF